MENLQFKATKTVRYIRDFNCYLGTVDVKAYPTVKVYLPSRSKPMTTLHPTDSIFWEEYGGSVTETFAHMIPDAQMLREASEFAGTIPVKQLLPFWKTGKRYLYTGGSVQTVSYTHLEAGFVGLICAPSLSPKAIPPIALLFPKL